MAIPDHSIKDLKSFNTATDGARRVAGLYFFFKLDCLIDLTYRVSHDFYDRPELFTNLAGVSPTIAGLHARYGCEEKFLNARQRHAIYAALFGKPAAMNSAAADEEGNFPNLRDELTAGCATFVETKFGDEDSLRENVRQKHRLFKEYLTGLGGDSVAWSRGALASLTEEVTYQILRNSGVSAAYGIAAAPKREWPYTFDSNADKLVEKVSMHVGNSQKSEPPDMQAKHAMRRYVSREEITNLQRAAIEGARAIASVLDYSENGPDDKADLGKVITRCYTWGAALKNLKNYPRTFSDLFVPQSAERPRGGIAMAQPLPGTAMASMKG